MYRAWFSGLRGVENTRIWQPSRLRSGRQRIPQIWPLDAVTRQPEPAQAPSNLGIVGRYILMPQIFDVIETTKPQKNREIQITDALHILLEQQPIYAYEFEGVRYDTGTPLGWLKATFAYALRHPDFGPELREYLRQYL